MALGCQMADLATDVARLVQVRAGGLDVRGGAAGMALRSFRAAPGEVTEQTTVVARLPRLDAWRSGSGTSDLLGAVRCAVTVLVAVVAVAIKHAPLTTTTTTSRALIGSVSVLATLVAVAIEPSGTTRGLRLSRSSTANLHNCRALACTMTVLTAAVAVTIEYSGSANLTTTPTRRVSVALGAEMPGLSTQAACFVEVRAFSLDVVDRPTSVALHTESSQGLG